MHAWDGGDFKYLKNCKDYGSPQSVRTFVLLSLMSHIVYICKIIFE